MPGKLTPSVNQQNLAKENTGFEFQRSGLEQLERIVALNQKIFAGLYCWEPYNLAQYQGRLAGKNVKIFIAQLGSELVGSVISFEQDGALYLWALGVKLEYRNMGLASKLFEFTENAAVEMKLPSVILKVYNVSKEMLRLAILRGYQVTAVEPSDIDPKFNAVHLELKIKK